MVTKKNIYISTDTMEIPHHRVLACFPEVMSGSHDKVLLERVDIIFHDVNILNSHSVHCDYSDLNNMHKSVKKKTWLYHYNDIGDKMPDMDMQYLLGYNEWHNEDMTSYGHNLLYDLGIKHEYEIYLKLGKERVSPDFYLPLLDKFIEFWGLTDDPDYQQRKNKKISLYKSHDVEFLSLYAQDVDDHQKLMKKIL
ncbi:hypothetical protein LCGC14_1396370 [marine sediment metagenome]|uniref:Uncharacterized protein n=1 Tax=marine sediment metagenome TaxID=412755 RepID=A0A0F9JYN0_9ZZZZ